MNKNALFFCLLIGMGQVFRTHALSPLTASAIITSSAIFSGYSLHMALTYHPTLPVCGIYHHHSSPCNPKNGSALLFYGGLAGAIFATILLTPIASKKATSAPQDRKKNINFALIADWLISTATLYALQERTVPSALAVAVKAISSVSVFCINNANGITF